MRAWMLAFVLVAAGCGNDAAPPAPPPKPAPPEASPAPPPGQPAARDPEIQGDPAGKNLCLQCGLKTNEKACPKCKTVLVADSASSAPKAPGDVGRSSLKPTYACPREGCKFTSARQEKCLPHPDTDLKEVWYVCSKDGAQTTPGKCAKCGADLVRQLR